MAAMALCLPSSPPINPNRHGTTSARPPHQTITFESLKNHLIRQANAGRLREAMSTIDSMLQDNLTPDLTAYSVLLKSCIRTRNYDLGRLVHSKIIESGIQLDVIVFNSLISLYSKCGDWRKSEEIFHSMGELRDLVSWSAMISCYAHNGMNFQAILVFIEMLGFAECPNEYCFSAAIRACSNREYAEIGLAIFGFLIKTGHFESDVCVGCALIDFFFKGFGDLGFARKVFDEMPVKNAVTWTLMITRLTQMGYPQQAVQLFLDMILSGFLPDRFTFSSCISACSEIGLSQTGQQIHSWVIKNGLSQDVCVGCSLVDMYAKSAMDGSMDESRKVFDRMPEQNVMSWTALITGYVQNGGFDDNKAISFYIRMITEGSIKPNHFTFAALLKACGNLFDPVLGEQVYGHAVKSGLATINCVGNSLISMFTKSDRMEDARKAFEFLFEKNLVSYNALIDGYAKNSNSDEAFELFRNSSSIGVDAFTFASLLSGAASIGAVGKGEQLHARLIKFGLESNLCVSNSLISMYTRCGDIESGLRVFNEMGDNERNVVSWTAIIAGFAKHGIAKQALDFFTQMLDFGIQPNEVTYIAVLSACSHAGLISEAWNHFNSMSKHHGICPRMDHYACMVDVLARSGDLHETVNFINTMPFPANALVWRTLLSGCCVHGDIKLGQHAAEKILEKNPNDPSAHVLLSNLYASSGQQDKAARIRKEMKERGLLKEAGCSWIEVSNKVHKFYVGDTKHPEAEEIYGVLEEVWGRVREMGYVADTRFVGHELEGEEEKEKYLMQHSERIALGYGLLRLDKGMRIRIFKNLRVCGDCHKVFKYASLVTGREIVVRDSNRFHHFKDGFCSCNDYW